MGRGLRIGWQGTPYTTSFPTIANPLSEGGRWRLVSPLVTPCQISAAGKCHGTQDGVGGFNDSHAYFTALTPGNDYEIIATVFKVGTPEANTECELLLRYWDGYATYSTAYGDTNSKGYELSHQSEGSYAHVGRWKGADIDTPTPLGAMANGDIWRARIEGFRVRWWITPVSTGVEVLLSDVTDTDAGLKIATGYPGVGFYIGSGAVANNVLGFSSVTFRKL